MWKFGSKSFIAMAFFMLLGVRGPASLGLAVDAIEWAEGAECPLCGMYIEQFRRTAFEVTFSDGRRGVYCGVACGIRAINDAGGMGLVKSAKATEWGTEETLDATTCSYVIGSDTIPDMLPSLLPFDSEDKAKNFQEKHGGALITLDKALNVLSAHALTIPFRVAPAAVPPEGKFSEGTIFKTKRMGDLLKGSSSQNTNSVARKAGKAPDSMQAFVVAEKLVYAITDDLVASVTVPYIWKELEGKARTPVGLKDTDMSNDGIGDTVLSFRYRLAKDVYYDKHLALQADLSLPTGDFDDDLRQMAGLQMGTSALGFTGGILYSQHFGPVWAHAGINASYPLENAADYRFGESYSAATAVHWTINSDALVGIELEGTVLRPDEDDGRDLPNSGREGVYGSLVGQYRVACFGGGNLKVRGMVGTALYEDVRGTQLGEDFRAVVGVVWGRRFLVDDLWSD